MRTQNLVSLIWCIPGVILCQSQKEVDSTEVKNPEIIEIVGDQIAEEEDAAALLDELELMEESPLDLNTSTVEDLQKIPGMTAPRAMRIIHRRDSVRFISKKELIGIEGFSREYYSTIQRYVKVNRRTHKSFHISYYNRLSTEIEPRKGFQDGSYTGSKIRMINKMHGILDCSTQDEVQNISRMEFGCVTKKDPGETSYADFASAFISCDVPLLSLRCIGGDYRAEIGEGLVLWTGPSFSKGGTFSTMVQKNGKTVRPFNSTDENLFLRGMALLIGDEKKQVQIFLSNRSLNATLDSSKRVTAFDQSGLFRTDNELKNRNAVNESLIGYHLTYGFSSSLKAGIVGYKTHFSHPLLLAPSANQTATDFWMNGIDLSYETTALSCFSECAIDFQNSVAILGGIIYEPNDNVALACSGRKIDPSFISLHGNVLGGSFSRCPQESGAYSGIQLNPVKPLTCSAYIERTFYGHPTAFVKSECSLRLEYQITVEDELSLRYWVQQIPTNYENWDAYGRKYAQTGEQDLQSYRLTNKLNFSPSGCLISKVGWTVEKSPAFVNPETGMFLSQSILYSFISKIFLKAQVTLFDADSYVSRLYDFEYDLPGAYSNPALFGKGMRWVIILQYEPFPLAQISFKYSQSNKADVAVLGSGLDEITGNHQSTISTQVQFQW